MTMHVITIVTNNEYNHNTQLHGNNLIQNHVYKQNAYYDLYHKSLSQNINMTNRLEPRLLL